MVLIAVLRHLDSLYGDLDLSLLLYRTDRYLLPYPVCCYYIYYYYCWVCTKNMRRASYSHRQMHIHIWWSGWENFHIGFAVGCTWSLVDTEKKPWCGLRFSKLESDVMHLKMWNLTVETVELKFSDINSVLLLFSMRNINLETYGNWDSPYIVLVHLYVYACIYTRMWCFHLCIISGFYWRI